MPDGGALENGVDDGTSSFAELSPACIVDLTEYHLRFKVSPKSYKAIQFSSQINVNKVNKYGECRLL